MLAIYKKCNPNDIHIWYDHDRALNYHGIYVDFGQSSNLPSNSRFWIAKLINNINDHIIKSAINIWIHGKSRRIVDLDGFDSVRKIEIMENYLFGLANVRACIVTLITSSIPVNMRNNELKTIQNKLVNSNGILKHFIVFRTAYLIQPNIVGENITKRGSA